MKIAEAYWSYYKKHCTLAQKKEKKFLSTQAIFGDAYETDLVPKFNSFSLKINNRYTRTSFIFQRKDVIFPMDVLFVVFISLKNKFWNTTMPDRYVIWITNLILIPSTISLLPYIQITVLLEHSFYEYPEKYFLLQPARTLESRMP